MHDHWISAFTTQICSKFEKLSIPLRNVKVDPWLETSYDYALLYSSISPNKYMLMVKTKTLKQAVKYLQCQTRTSSGQCHWLRSSVFIVNCQHISHLNLVPVLSAWTSNLLWHSIYTWIKRLLSLTFYCRLHKCIYFMGLIFLYINHF